MSLLLRPLSTLYRAASPAVARTSNNTLPIISTITPPNSTSTTTTHRTKHSATQVKRLFKNNPARLRLLKKSGHVPKKLIIPSVTYPAIYHPTFLGNGWSAPPNPDEIQIPEYPFKVKRTGRKPFGSVGFLPVYRDIR